MKHLNKLTILLIALTMGTSLMAQNNCLDYDGIDDYVDCGNNSSLNITDAITIEAWMKPSADNWKYKKPITLNPVTPEADYQIRVRLTTSNFNYSNAQTDGDDVRFFDSNGNLLNYWIEVWDNTGTSTIWVKVTTSGTGTIYMYYGNPTATPESNGTNTFEFFDDFESYAEGSAIDGQGCWTTMRTGGTGYAKVNTKNGKKHLCVSSTHDATVVVHAYSSSGSLCIGSRAYRASSSAEAYSPGFGDGNVITTGLMLNGYMSIWYGWGGSPSAIYKSVGGIPSQIGLDDSGTSAQNTYYLFDFVWNGNDLESYRDSTLILSGTDNTFTSQTHVHLSSWGTSIWDTDWIFIRKYASSEPFATIGNENAAGISKAGSYGIGANTTTAFAGINDQALSGTISSGWNHIAFTYNKNAGGTDEMKLYINGVQKATGDYSIAISTNTNNFFIGDLIGFVGPIDEVRIWNTARTAQQIRDNINELENPGDETNLMAYYSFNEGSGQISEDLSQNNNTAVLGGSLDPDPSDPEWIISTAPMTCLYPYNQIAINIGITSADLGWTENGSSTTWDIELGNANFTPTGIPTAPGVTSNPYTYNYLIINTTYDWYVRADCEEGDYSAWVGPHTFTTLPSIHSLPLTEDFENGFTYFGNTIENGTNWVINTSYYHEGVQCASNAYAADNSNILYETGLLDLTTTYNPKLRFWNIAKTQGEYDHCYVEISINGGLNWTILPASTYLGEGIYEYPAYNNPEGPCFDEESYTEWGTGSQIPDNATWWRMESFDLSDYKNTDVSIRFRLVSNSTIERAGWYIDDILIADFCEFDLTVFLESPYESGGMNTYLNDNGFIFLEQPYNPALPYYGNMSPVWLYEGTESVTDIPAGVVDWVLVQLRDADAPGNADSGTILSTQAAFLLSDGSVVDIDGIRNISIFNLVYTQNLYAVIYHRNHLGIISNNPLVEDEGIYTYDFSTGEYQVYPDANGHKQLAPNVWGMIAGDGDGNGEINSDDKSNAWLPQAGTNGYESADFKIMNGQVNNQDKNDIWLINTGFNSQIPE